MDVSHEKVSLVASLSPDLVERGLSAADLVKAASAALGGKGGGRADMASGGGTGPENLGAAFDAARDYLRETLAGGGGDDAG